MRSGQWPITDGIKLLNQEKKTTLREKENFRYLEILEAAPVKKAEMKAKNNISEQESLKLSSVAEISFKG